MTGPPCSRPTRGRSACCGRSTRPPGRPSDPLGWRFQAAIHGLAAPAEAPDTSNALWSNCQHGSWYFLPWHRMYLAAFELIIQDALGDEDVVAAVLVLDRPRRRRQGRRCRRRSCDRSRRQQPADRRALADRAVRTAVLRRHPGRPPEHLAASTPAVADRFATPRGVCDVRGWRAQRPELQRRRGRAAGGRAARRCALAGRQRLRRRQQLVRRGLDGVVLHRRARPDLLAAPRQHRPALAGLARSSTPPPRTRPATRPSSTRSSPSRARGRGP